MVDVSSLVIKVDSREVKVSARELEKFARSGGKADKQTKKLSRSTRDLSSNFGSLRGVAASLGGALAFRGIVRAADTFQLLNARIALVSGTTKEAEQTYSDLLDMSQRTRSELESTITLYTRLARATEQLGLTSGELLTTTEAITQAFKISGASTAEAGAAAIQLSQAMASGVLRGEEFNSISEQAPRILKALGDELGKTTGELRAMAKQGLLTANVVSSALINQSKVIQAEFEKIPVTVSDALTQMANDATDAFGRTDVSPLVDAIDDLRGIITDKGFQSSMVTLGTSIANIAAGLASAASEGVKFSRWVGEELAAAVGGVAFDDMIRLDQKVADLIDTIAIVEGKPFLLFKDSRLKELRDELDETRAKIASFKDFQEGFAPTPDIADETGTPRKAGGGVVVTPKATAIEKRIKSLEMEAAALGKTRKEIVMMGDAYKAATTEQKASIESSLDSIAAFDISAALAKTEQAKADARASDFEGLVESLRSEEQAIQDSYARRLDIVLTNTAENSTQQLALLEKLAQERADALAALEEEDPFGLAEEFATRAKENIQDSLADAIVNGVRDGGKSALESFGDMLLQMAAQAAAAQIMDGIFSSVSSGSNSAGGGGGVDIGSLVGMFAGFFDSGGNIPRGQFGIAGENGPEIIQGPANVTSTKDTASMGGTNNITIHMAGGGNENENRIAGGQVARQVLGAIGSFERFR